MFAHLSTRARPYVIATWGGVLSLITASLMVSHWVSLPRPTVGQSLASLSTLSVASEAPLIGESATSAHSTGKRTNIQTFHVIYQSCPCSRRVLTHLLKRPAIEQANEEILLITEPQDGEVVASGQSLTAAANSSAESEWRQQAAALGYKHQTMTPRELFDRHGLESSPLLLIVDDGGNVLFSGGYTSRKQGMRYQDELTIHAVLNGETPAPIPVFGCAVSKQLQKIVDPLGLKY